MDLRKAILIVCAVALGLFLLCGIGELMVDSSSRGRDTVIEKTVSDVAARTDAAAADAAVALEQVNTATRGADGLACYDLNGNGTGDVEEDINGDGEYDVLDCRGADGAVGQKGDRGKPGFGVKVVLGGKNGKNGRDGKDCVSGGECLFTSVCCTDDGKSTVTAEPAKPTKPEPAKKPGKVKVKRSKKADEPRTSRFYQRVEVEVNGNIGTGRGGAPSEGDSNTVENNGGTVYYAPVEIRVGD